MNWATISDRRTAGCGLTEQLGNVPVLATDRNCKAPRCARINQQLGMVRPSGYKGSFFRPSLHIHCRKKGSGETRREILALIRARSGPSGIVYCLSRRTVEQTTEYLRRHGVRAAPYHAGLPEADRACNQDAFARDDVDVIVATITFAMVLASVGWIGGTTAELSEVSLALFPYDEAALYCARFGEAWERADDELLPQVRAAQRRLAERNGDRC